jgi:hypothetical protein
MIHQNMKMAGQADDISIQGTPTHSPDIGVP